MPGRGPGAERARLRVLPDSLHGGRPVL